MTRFIIFRHGETDLNQQGLLQGQSDIPLNATGREQAKQLGHQLKSLGIQMLVTSPLLRTKETALIVNEFLQVPIIDNADLKEANCGDLEGTHRTLYTDWFQQWESPLYPTLKPNGGETNIEIYQRALGVIKSYSSVTGTVGISTHGGIMRRLLNYRGCSQHVGNASYITLDYDPETDRFIVVK